jgi:hypothetical protein
MSETDRRAEKRSGVMPYKDPERKREWERLHRAERLARRRQLRQIEAVEHQPQRREAKVEFGNSALLIPIIAGGALTAYNPKIGIAVGGLTLASSAIFKKGWAWWLVGCVILALALFFYWKGHQDSETNSTNTA